MGPQFLSWDEELFLQALVEPLEESGRESALLALFESSTELTPEMQDLILEFAPESQEVRNRLVEWIDKHMPESVAPELPKHIAQPTFSGEFVDFGNRRSRLVALLDEPMNRIISVIGQSGSGKSRLALEVVGGSPDRWAERSVWVNCRSIETDRELVRSVACSLSDEPGDWLSMELDRSILKERVLVVLDEFDPSQAYCSAVERLTSQHENVRIVVLSHDPLPFAQVAALPLLALEDNAEEAGRTFDLFLRTVQSIRRDLKNVSLPFEPIRRLGSRLAGLPIGISLAAGCFATAPQADLEALANQFATYSNRESLTAPLPLRDLAAYVLRGLSADEYEYLQSLSLLQGGFSDEEASWLTDSGGDVGLAHLVRVGLVQPTESATTAQYEVPELVRDQLRPASDAAKLRYVDSFVAVGEGIRLYAGHGEYKTALRSLLDHLLNLTEAARIASQTGHYDQVAKLFRSIGRFMFEANMIPEFEKLAGFVRSSNEPDIELQIQLLGLEGANAAMHKNNEECIRIWNVRLELARGFGDPFYLADTIGDIASLAFEMGDFAQSIDMMLESELIAVNNSFIEVEASAKIIRARANFAIGDRNQGEDLLRQVMEQLPKCQDEALTPFVYQNAVLALDYLGETDTARSLLVALLAQASRTERSILTGWALVQLGNRYVSDGLPEGAAQCYIAASKVYRVTSSKHYIRATDRLRKFREDYGDEWTAKVEDELPGSLVQLILDRENPDLRSR